MVIVSLSGAENGAPQSQPVQPDSREPAQPPVQTPAAPQTGTAPVYTSASGAPPPASPTIRKMAKELGIDLTRVRGSKNGGRIVIEDVRAYIQGLQAAQTNHGAKGCSGSSG